MLKHILTPLRFKHLLAGSVTAALVAGLFLHVAEASTWSPTLLVNTEAFQVIDDGDGSTNIELRFGDTANEILRWDVGTARFQFTDDVHIEGNITGSGTLITDGAISTKGNLTINSDNGGANAVLTFGNDAAGETITFNDTTNEFDISDDVNVTGTFDTTGNITTDANLTINEDSGGADAVLTFGNDGGDETFTFSDTSNNFELSDDLDVTGTMNTTGNITTDANLEINEDSGAVDAVLTFGSDGSDETLTFINTEDTFEFSDDLQATGSISASGALIVDGATTLNAATIINSTLDTTGNITTDANLTINEDNGAANAVLTFGNDSGVETITFSDSTNRFEFSDDIYTANTLTVDGVVTLGSTGTLISIGGIVYRFPASDATASGRVLATDGSGILSWAAAATDTDTTYDAGQGISLDGTTFRVDTTLTGAQLNFSTVSGAIVHARDQLQSSGTLLIGGAATFSSTIAATGNITTQGNMTINSDSGGANAVLTFGNDAADETITFSDSTNRFEFSDDIYTAATATIDGAVTLGSTLSLGGVAYTFPTNDGSASGKILSTDGSGNLSWTSIKTGSGNTVSLAPEYPNAVYYSSGSNAVGQLFASGGNLSTLENNYTWKTTRSGTMQDYWVSSRVKIPHNFSGWAQTPIQFRFRTGTDLLGDNHVTVKMYDTGNSAVTLGTGALAGTSWTTADITGPESSGTYTPDSYITLLVKLAASGATSAQANAGYLNLNWITTSPSG